MSCDCEKLEKKPSRKQRKKRALESIRDLRQQVLYGTGGWPLEVLSSVVEEIKAIVVEGIATWEELLGLTPEELARLALQGEALYYPQALKVIRRGAEYPYHAEAFALAIRRGIEKGAVTWEKLGTSETELDELMRTYEERYKNFKPFVP